MNWSQLLKPYRFEKNSAEGLSTRSEFDKDFDRVVFSSAFRHLQDKTQVIPLPENDFVHTRLTHSLEVSSVGRSLGRLVGEKLIEKYPELKNQISSYEIGSIVAAACLAHDIGNPPFGHSGEKAISEYFLNGRGKIFELEINDEKKWNDFINFEGNANGFKIITNYSGNSRGLHLAYPTLAAFTKYPKEGLPKYKSDRVSEKKYGIFQSEKKYFNDVAEKLGLKKVNGNEHLHYYRHPLAFLVEAADDICYSIIDFEDGLNLHLIDFSYAEKYLIPFVEKFDEAKFIKMNQEEQIAFLRANAINKLTSEVAEIFWTNEEKILNAEFDKALLDESIFKDQIKKIKKVSLEKVYKSRQVVEIEAAGFEVIAGLLHLCIQSVNHKYESSLNSDLKFYQSEKIVELIPEQFIGDNKIPSRELYVRVLKICEFIAGMTDTYAINFYRMLKGIELTQ